MCIGVREKTISPALLLNDSGPPWILMMSCEIESPRPDPSCLDETIGKKTCSWMSEGIPGPLSMILTSQTVA